MIISAEQKACGAAKHRLLTGEGGGEGEGEVISEWKHEQGNSYRIKDGTFPFVAEPFSLRVVALPLVKS